MVNFLAAAHGGKVSNRVSRLHLNHCKNCEVVYAAPHKALFSGVNLVNVSLL